MEGIYQLNTITHKYTVLCQTKKRRVQKIVQDVTKIDRVYLTEKSRPVKFNFRFLNM